MKTFLLIASLILGWQYSFSQEPKIEYLKAQRSLLEKEINKLEDSLYKIDTRIQYWKERQTTGDIELGPNELLAIKKIKIRSAPSSSSPVLIEIEKGTPVLKIDKIGSFYLVCFAGTCGYGPTEFIKKMEGPAISQKNDTAQEKKSKEKGANNLDQQSSRQDMKELVKEVIMAPSKKKNGV